MWAHKWDFFSKLKKPNLHFDKPKSRTLKASFEAFFIFIIMEQKFYLEIRQGEGGSDAELLVKEMTEIYLKSAKVNNLPHHIYEQRKGFVSICL